MILAAIALTQGQALAIGSLAMVAFFAGWAGVLEKGRRRHCPGRWREDGPDCDGDR